MARLFNLNSTIPTELLIEVDDLLVVAAIGCILKSGTGNVEILGPYLPGVIDENGNAIMPMGNPNTVLILARRPGTATIVLFFSDLLSGTSKSSTIRINIIAGY